VAVTKRVGSVSLDAGLHYTLVTEGSQDTDLGDLMSYDLAFSYHVPGKLSLDLVLEANGEVKQKEEISGSEDENSGGHILYCLRGEGPFEQCLSAFISADPVIQDFRTESRAIRISGRSS
jgi:hypothetical protein